MTSPLSLSKRVLTFPMSAAPADTLTLTNTSAEPAAFKVKTTNPQRYVVRPNLGALAPGASVTISVALHRAAAGGAADADLVAGPARDKFLLQAAPAPGLASGDAPAAFWAAGLPPGTASLKLRVAFGEAAGERAAGGRNGGGGGGLGGAAARGHLPDAEELLREGNGAAARERAEQLQAEVDGKAAGLAKMRAELAERKAETARVLADAPRAPVSAARAVTDPFGGVSVAAVALFVVLVAVVVKTVFLGRDVAV